jgi:hypothetical protein
MARRVLLPFPSSFQCTSDHQSQQDNEPEPQRRNGRLVLPPQVLRVVQLTAFIIQFACQMVLEELAPLYLRTPYHTSALSGADWVQELLTGHPRRIQTELGVSRSTFVLLLKSIQALGVKSSRHVSVEEQLAIFLYTVVTGLPCTHVGERFQRTTGTITK